VLAGAASATDPRRCDYFKPDFFNDIGQNGTVAQAIPQDCLADREQPFEISRPDMRAFFIR